MPKDERSPWVLVVAVLTVAAVCADSRGQDMRRRKKLIATGWDQPSSRELPGILRDVERRPFDGLVVPVVGQTSVQDVAWFDNEELYRLP